MMKKLSYLLFLLPAVVILIAINFSDPWLTDFEEAKKEAKESGKPILLYFSGSDWCGVCIKMKKEVLDTETFEDYASENLIQMQADFPRMKKNKLDAKTTKQNEELAEKYNPSGVFPHVVLLNPEGKVLKEWKGYTSVKPADFINQIKACKQHI